MENGNRIVCFGIVGLVMLRSVIDMNKLKHMDVVIDFEDIPEVEARHFERWLESKVRLSKWSKYLVYIERHN